LHLKQHSLALEPYYILLPWLLWHPFPHHIRICSRHLTVNMAFAVLNEEKKIQRRKEKEVARAAELNAAIKEAAAAAPSFGGKWADASDDEGENAEITRLQKPVSDSESEASEDEDNSPKEENTTKGVNGTSPNIAVISSEKVKPEPVVTKVAPKKKKQEEKKDTKQEESMDDILAEMGIQIEEESMAPVASKKKKKNKDKEAVAENGEAKEAEERKASKQPAPKEQASSAVEEEELDEAKKAEALEALKKKAAAKAKKPTTSSAAKCAAEEAKKRAAGKDKKEKKDKSMYDR